MGYLIFFIVIAVVVGPIMWMMPTPRQRRQIDFRQYALGQGFQITVCDLPQTHRDNVRRVQPRQGVAYRLPLQQERPSVVSDVYRIVRQGDSWEWISEPPVALRDFFIHCLQSLPISAVAVDYSGSGVACYWSEQGTHDDIDAIKQALVTLREQLKGCGQ